MGESLLPRTPHPTAESPSCGHGAYGHLDDLSFVNNLSYFEWPLFPIRTVRKHFTSVCKEILFFFCACVVFPLDWMSSVVFMLPALFYYK